MSLLTTARSIADTVLYEGYLLYPYRSSSSKNQLRWQYGIVGPAGGVEAGVGEESMLQTECLIATVDAADAGVGSDADPRVDIYLRFLQVQARTVETAAEAAGQQFQPVAELRFAGTTWLPWDEAVEQEIPVLDVAVAELAAGRTVDVQVPGGEEVELLHDGVKVAGRVVRRRLPLTGRLHLSATLHPGARPLWTLRCRLDNISPHVPAAADAVGASPRDVAARQSFVGTHLLLVARHSAFVSLIDPPAWAAEAAGGCANRRAWPVLVGQPGQTDVVLASPIILPDYPELAPESPGSLYDSLEIDEILTLRVMTLTDEEKVAARATDPRAAEIIDRSDLMPPEVFEKLHGALRGFGTPTDLAPTDLAPTELAPTEPAPIELAPIELAPTETAPTETAPANIDADGVPWWGEERDASVKPESDAVRIGTVDVSKGSRVRLRPSRRADAQDLFLADRTAVVARVDSDVDGATHVAVLLEDDEMAEIHGWYGRYYYFAPDELEPLQPRRASEPQAGATG